MKKLGAISSIHWFAGKLVLTIFLPILLSTAVRAQEAGLVSYTPPEQLIHPVCVQAADKNHCLWNFLAGKIRKVMAREIPELNTLRDTLKVRITFKVDHKGQLSNTFKTIDISNELLLNACKNAIDRELRRLPRFNVLHRKEDRYSSMHDFKYQFLVINSVRGKRLEMIAPPEGYTGGYILELPVFPGCEGLSFHNSNECFQQMITQHIATNLSYPKEAERQKIQGDVRIVCIMNKEGLLEDIRARGGHYLLKQEAIRIMRLAPRCIPALHDGVPVAIPYSIPISFKLKN